MVEDNPLDLENIKERQDHDEKLMRSAVKYPEWYSCKSINNDEDILCYTKPGDISANWKIALPDYLINLLLSGIIRLLNTHKTRGSMDNYNKNTIIEIYVEWLTTSTLSLAREIN
jgi:hypothetical protein